MKDLSQVTVLLKAMASQKLPEDKEDFMIDDYAGGNLDDAYQLGETAGEVIYARHLLKFLGEA